MRYSGLFLSTFRFVLPSCAAMCLCVSLLIPPASPSVAHIAVCRSKAVFACVCACGALVLMIFVWTPMGSWRRRSVGIRFPACLPRHRDSVGWSHVVNGRELVVLVLCGVWRLESGWNSVVLAPTSSLPRPVIASRPIQAGDVIQTTETHSLCWSRDNAFTFSSVASQVLKNVRQVYTRHLPEVHT